MAILKHIKKDLLEQLDVGEHFVDASTLEIPAGDPHPSWIEIIDGGYVQDHYEFLKQNIDEVTGEFISTHYISTAGNKLIVMND